MMKIEFGLANQKRTIPVLVVVAFFVAAVPFLPPFLFYMLTMLLIDFIVVVSFRFIALHGGWSFAHVALWGMGAYATALLTVKLSLPLWLGIPVAGLVTAVCALLIAFPCLRTTGVYFFMSTFAVAEGIRQMWIRWEGLFGGHDGIHSIPTLGAVPSYYLVLGLTVLSVAIMYRLEFSRVGSSIKAIASNERLAESIGIHAWRYKILAFVIGGLFVGLAGALFAHKTGTVAPSDFVFLIMVSVLVASLLGGMTSIFGPMIGVSVVRAIEYFGMGLLDWLPLLEGCIVIIVILFLPGGLISLPQRISAWRQGGKRDSKG